MTTKRELRAQGYAGAVAELCYQLRNDLPSDYTHDATTTPQAQLTEVVTAARRLSRARVTQGWENAIATAAEALQVPPRHLNRTGREPMTMTELVLAVTEARDDAVQAALRTVAAELLPPQAQEALGSRYTADDLALALGEHFTAVAADNGRAGYRKGYAATLVNAARDQDTADDGATLRGLQFTGRPVDTEALGKARHRAATEVAQAVARQLYGDAGRSVRNAADLIELVRGRTELQVREATGEAIHEGTAVHTPLRDERIRREALRAVASWVSQNWQVEIAEETLRTPEELGAALTTVLSDRVERNLRNYERRVRQQTEHALLQELHNRVFGPDGEGQDTLPPTMTVAAYADGLSNTIKDGKWQAESMAMDGLLRDLNIPRPETVDNLVREDAAAEIRRHITTEADRRARAASATVRRGTMQEISDELSRIGFWRDTDDHRLTWKPVITGSETPTQFAVRIHNQRTATLVRRSRHRRDMLLRGLGRGDLVGQVTTVTGVLKVISEMLDEQTELTAYRIIRESLGLDAAKPLRDQMQDGGAIDRERVIATAAGAVNAVQSKVRNERERVLRHIGTQVFGEEYNVTAAPNEDVLLANIKAAVRRPATVLGWSQANHRYAQLRRRYSVEHDRSHHTAEDFRSSVLAILLGPNDAVISRIPRADGEGLVTWSERTPVGLWKLGPTAALDWARERKQWYVEATALLMCAAEAWPQ